MSFENEIWDAIFKILTTRVFKISKTYAPSFLKAYQKEISKMLSIYINISGKHKDILNQIIIFINCFIKFPGLSD